MNQAPAPETPTGDLEREVRAELERRRLVLVKMRREEFATGRRPELRELQAANRAVLASYAALALLRGLA